MKHCLAFISVSLLTLACGDMMNDPDYDGWIRFIHKPPHVAEDELSFYSLQAHSTTSPLDGGAPAQDSGHETRE